MTDATALCIVCPLTFAAGFIDSIAGGGGLISLPAYLVAGLPVHTALGTNKFSSTFGTIFSAARFIAHKQVHWRSVLYSIAGSLAGSFCGAKAALALQPRILECGLVIFLPLIAVVILRKKNFGEQETHTRLSSGKMTALSLGTGLIIGAYDGFFGPGTGTFLILVYTGWIGFNFTLASGNAKLVNLASNISALATFAIGGKVLYTIGLPAAFCGILGHWIGSGLALRNGARIIRPVFITVLILLFLTVLWNLGVRPK
jgi:uncharacterized membrane protein YfcA